MSLPVNRLIIIGENFNATRKIKATNPKVFHDDGKFGIAYTDFDGTKKLLDCTDILPDDPDEQRIFLVPHIAQALRTKDMDYIRWIIRSQEEAGAHIIDLCVDEMSVYPEERYEWIRWLVTTVQSITDTVISIDSSDSETIRAGLEAHDGSRSRPAINSFNQEDGRQVLVRWQKKEMQFYSLTLAGTLECPKTGLSG